MPTNVDVCPASMGGNKCNRRTGHDGPHGLEIAPGMILAPFQGSTHEADELTTLGCNCCDKPMYVSRSGRAFRCSSCSQTVFFRADGGWSEAVVPRMYPALAGMSREMQAEAVDYHYAQRIFQHRAMAILDGADESTLTAAIAEELRLADDYKARVAPSLLVRVPPVISSAHIKPSWLDRLTRWFKQ